MRLSGPERQAIVEEIRRKAPDAKVYLYGSRADDRLKGGDIDVLAICDGVDYMDRVDILIAIKARIGDQKIDLKILSPAQARQDAFVQSVLPQAILL